VIAVDIVAVVLRDDVHWCVFTKICHPADGVCFLEHVVNDEVLRPFSGIRVGEIDHSKLDAKTLDQISFILLVFKEIAVFVTFLKVVGSNFWVASEIGEVWVHIDHWSDTISFPVGNHIVPVKVVFSIELPIPEKSDSFRELECADPVLHPNSFDWDTLRFQEGILRINFILSTLETNNCTFLCPCWQSFLPSCQVCNTLNDFFQIVSVNEPSVNLFFWFPE